MQLSSSTSILSSSEIAMKITYDAEVDAMYVQLLDGEH
jgi:hypothetical protein